MRLAVGFVRCETLSVFVGYFGICGLIIVNACLTIVDALVVCYLLSASSQRVSFIRCIMVCFLAIVVYVMTHRAL